MKLSIVIVNYNVKHYLWQCLDSVERAKGSLDMEVWVVDNASSDGSIDELRQAFPHVHYIENQVNLGFSRANNQAIRQSTGDYVLLLNPDTILAENTLADCLHFFERHPNAGAVGIHMVNRNGSFARESRRGIPTPATAFYKVSGLCALFPTHPRFGHYYMSDLPEDAEGEIEVISGAFMMLRREVLDDVGLLDEDYFMYGEDIDLSYRVGRCGWECWYTPLHMLHYKGESTQKTSFRYVQNFYNAMLIFFRKHFARRYWFTWIAVEIVVVLLSAIAIIRNTLKKYWYRLKHFLQQISGTTSETLCFIGSDQAWDVLRPICERAGLQARHVSDLSQADRHTTYLTFEVTEGEYTYGSALMQLQKANRLGYHGLIGTFNMKNPILILPNDIFC